MKVYVAALDGCSLSALRIVCKRAIQGRQEKFSKTWAPTPPELASAVREWERSQRTVVSIPSTPVRKETFEDRKRADEEKYANVPIIEANVTFEDAVRRYNEYNAKGHVYVPRLKAIYEYQPS